MFCVVPLRILSLRVKLAPSFGLNTRTPAKTTSPSSSSFNSAPKGGGLLHAEDCTGMQYWRNLPTELSKKAIGLSLKVKLDPSFGLNTQTHAKTTSPSSSIFNSASKGGGLLHTEDCTGMQYWHNLPTELSKKLMGCEEASIYQCSDPMSGLFRMGH